MEAGTSSSPTASASTATPFGFRNCPSPKPGVPHLVISVPVPVNSLRPDPGTPQPFYGDALYTPLAIYVTDARRAALGGWERLYWTDEQHVHWRAFDERGRTGEFVVLDQARYATDAMTVWRRVPAVEEGPLEWGRFILGLCRRAAERAAANEAWTFRWQGYEVVAFPAGPPPVLLRTHMPAVTDCARRRTTEWRVKPDDSH
jgi:hypothetical protein